MIYTITLNPALDKEYIVPKLSTNKVLRSSSIQTDYGGKGFNVSRMLASFGTASIAVGFIGGASGEILRDGLEGMGIRTDFVEVSGETRTNVSVVSSVDEQYIKVNETGAHIIGMSSYAYLLAKALGINNEESELIRNAAPMHDVEKIGIPGATLVIPVGHKKHLLFRSEFTKNCV